MIYKLPSHVGAFLQLASFGGFIKDWLIRKVITICLPYFTIKRIYFEPKIAELIYMSCKPKMTLPLQALVAMYILKVSWRQNKCFIKLITLRYVNNYDFSQLLLIFIYAIFSPKSRGKFFADREAHIVYLWYNVRKIFRASLQPCWKV